MTPTIKSALLHAGLFIITLTTTILAGAEWATGKTIDMEGFTWTDFSSGLPYGLSFLFILTVHEFGHYFTAVYHKVRTTLPYYIPLPPFYYLFGTMGAVIRIKDRISSRQKNFDIGIAGPLAGFVAALVILTYAFTHLPPPEYVFQFHPEYKQFGLNYAQFVYRPEFMKDGGVVMGQNLLFMFFEKIIANPARVPNPYEVMHYPLLFAGFLSLVFTSLNLLPIGQLDGGHVLYGLLGYEGHRRVASAVFIVLLFFAGLGYVDRGSTNEWIWKIPLAVGFTYLCLLGLRRPRMETMIYALSIFVLQFALALSFPAIQGYPGWLLFLFIIGRFIGVQHPPALNEEPLSRGRKLLGWLAFVIFILCFTPSPIEVIAPTGAP
jgi:membrane-associated protease RseP (regulator of RpoE activity)